MLQKLEMDITKMESWTSQFWEENATDCMEKLKANDAWLKIPLMNTTPSYMLTEGQLVRFQGMVQDMYNPVYYLARYEVLNTITDEKSLRSGKYKDSLECAEHERVLFDSDATVNKERRPVYCISVPGVNTWAMLKKDETKPNRKIVNSEQPAGSCVKRSVEDESVEASDPISTAGSKRLCTPIAMETGNNESAGDSLRTDLNLPIPCDQASACLINLYDVEDDRLKLNDVIEVAGFLSFDPALVLSAADGMAAETLPPPSLVPRLHAIAVRPSCSCNPLLTPVANNLDDVMLNAARLRGELKLVLTQLLLGDTLAADYLICHLISRIYVRQEPLVLGKFSLNLSRVPCSVPDYTTRLYNFLQTLVVKSHYLPMTLDTMNTTTMIPRKNYETNRLESGMLQLTEGTHLVLDETRLQPGQLNDKGVRNCRALGALITNQRLEYDFQYYAVDFNTDIPVLILSEGKSMLPSDCQLALEVDAGCLSTVGEVFSAAVHYMKEPLLSQLRVYLSLVSTAEYSLTPELEQIVQEDFVKLRQEQPKFTAQDLHFLLNLAKLLALSQGLHCLTKECWNSAQQMERQRKERLAS